MNSTVRGVWHGFFTGVCLCVVVFVIVLIVGDETHASMAERQNSPRSPTWRHASGEACVEAFMVDGQ
jgi:hypothetical protein